jgi:hypothetical protein
MAFVLLDQIRSIFDGDPGVRRLRTIGAVGGLLLFRMIRPTVRSAKVKWSPSGASAGSLRHSRSASTASSNISTVRLETNGSQAIAQFRDLDVERRKLLATWRNAKPITQLAESEVRLLRRTLDLLDISPVDVVKSED